ncbi:MAG: hypothetical protein V1682_06375 [Candidatus Omnitrophota bacterium]
MNRTIVKNNRKVHTRDLQTALNDEIARTYLKTSEKSYIRKKAALRLAWSIAGIASILAVAAFITKVNLDVRVRILGEIPSVSVERGRINFDYANDRGVFLIKGISVNNDIVKATFFAGDANLGSRTGDDYILLSNAKGSGWGNFTIELKEPLALNQLDLKFVARGSSGGELLGIVIADTDNKTYRMERDLATKLTGEWQLYKVNFRPVKRSVDLGNIRTIKFEFGSLTVGNSSGAAIFLKDVYVAKARRSRWL